ncbi:MAG: hypothetical protein IPN44_01390 [Flavobacteriales bacterium]|nr:hypothetical protein [Flavobacteriales bacterium]
MSDADVMAQRNFKILCWAVLLCWLPLHVQAQSAEQFITWGDRALAVDDAYGASRYYGEALQAQPGILETQWKYAEACRLSNQYGEASLFYEKVASKDRAGRHREAWHWLAEMQMCSGQYDAAAITWAKVKQKERKKESWVAQRADNGLEGCRLAKAMLAAPDTSVLVAHLPMPVNSFDSEFGARTGPDSALYFTSLRGEANADGAVLDTVNYHARVFRSTENGDAWKEPAALNANVNTQVNNANSAWSVDGKWFYFSRDDGTGVFSIWGVEQGRTDAVAQEVMHADGASCTQPMVALLNGVQTLFYTKRNSGERTDMDLWSCTLDGARTSNAAPLQGPVNTLGNETAPFYISATNTLWYSSDFLPGLGGYDIFKSQLGTGGFSASVNVGTPLNSPANDLYPAYYPETATGWLTSNRTGSFAEKGSTCCNDLYRFSYPTEVAKIAARRVLVPLPPLPEETPPDALTDAQWKRITSLREKLPIRLYFHNDEPDPRSWDTTTTADYAGTYRSYSAKKPEYDAAWAATPSGPSAIDAFFAQQVDRGYVQLNDFTGLLKVALDEGQHITLQVRGYASPLAKSDYNKNLSLRRIATLVHYLERTDHGALVPYLNGNAANGGRLVVVPQPFGKSTADASVSDRLDDLQHSVYGVGAAMERRIEIEQVVGR